MLKVKNQVRVVSCREAGIGNRVSFLRLEYSERREESIIKVQGPMQKLKESNGVW